MADVRELRRFPPGEFCPNCGSQKWYILDGMRYCSRDHQIEGFIQFDVGDELDAGQLGTVAKRDKEVRETDKARLSGRAGQSLYLEAIQLALRNQLLWLINDQGHRDELETIVRDLWDLRIRGFESDTLDESTGEDVFQTFSSQPVQDENTTVQEARGRSQSWDPETGQNWPLPKVLDTLALCYLGCVLLRIPTRIGQILKWVNSGSMPYRRMFYNLPRDMQERMPLGHTTALKLPLRQPLGGEELYKAVMDLAISYHFNYEMSFPEINHVPMLVQYATTLALPIEPIAVARELASTLRCQFRLPTVIRRVLPLDYPEIRLAALLVVATKLCFPFTSTESPLNGDNFQFIPTHDWKKWQAAVAGSWNEKESPSGLSFNDVTSERVASLTDVELNEYFSHVSSFVDKRNDNPITQFFPTETSPPLAIPATEISEQLQKERAKILLRQTVKYPINYIQAKAQSSAGLNSPQLDPGRYEAVSDLEGLRGTALNFYQAIGSEAGIPLKILVRSVYTLEHAIISWQRSQREVDSGQGDEETTS